MKDGKRLEATPEANNIEKMSNSGLRTYQNGGITAVLQLPCAEESDSGSYTCVAENGYERIESSATVLIEQGIISYHIISYLLYKLIYCISS